jgi:hypothetical protein
MRETDWLFRVWLSRIWKCSQESLIIVKPDSFAGVDLDEKPFHERF